jgi:uncharacterized protein YjbJ (UPF0337 family)
MAWMDKLKNMAQVSRGRAKRAAGKATGNKSLEADGLGDQLVGNEKQASEKVKDAFKRR